MPDSSSDESSISDNSDEDVFGRTITDYPGFNKADDDNDILVRQMKAILALRELLGINKDKAFLKEQKKKEKERKRLENMTREQRIRIEGEQAMAMMISVQRNYEKKNNEKVPRRKSQEQDQRWRAAELRRALEAQEDSNGDDDKALCM